MSEAIFGIEPDQCAVVARKLKKASDTYAKMNILDEYGVGWGERLPALWALIRAGHYDAWDDPAIWPKLAEDGGLEAASAEDLVDLLAHVEHYDEQPGEDASEPTGDQYYDGGYEQPPFESERLVSYWPSALDTLAMHAYARDSELVESRASDCHPDVQKGLDLVRVRFGEIERDALPEETLESLAHIHVWGNLPWRVFDVVDGELTQLEIGQSSGDGPELKKRFISHFADEQAWAEAVLDAIFEEDYGPSFNKTIEAWPLAGLEQLEWMISNISLYNDDRVRAWELVLERDDKPAELLELAQNLQEDGRQTQAEFAAIASALRAKKLGEDAPEEALELISFRTVDNPTSRDKFCSLPTIIEALHAFDEDKAVARFFDCFDSDYGKGEAFPALRAFPEHEALLEKALETVETIAEDTSHFSAMRKPAFGLALLGPDALERLAEAFDASDKPVARATYRRAIMAILADADQPQDAAYDRFVSLADFGAESGASDHDLGHYASIDYRAALATMPEERAVARVGEDLADDKEHWHRAFSALEVLPNPQLFDRAFGLIGRQGLPPSDGYDWFRPLLLELGDQIEPYLGPALAASDSPEFHNVIKQHVGEASYDELLEAAGGTTAADKGPADKIRRLAEAAFETHPDEQRTVIYLFERLDEEPDGESLNRIGGRPFGVTQESWPTKNDDADSPMEHMFTLDLDTVPALRSQYENEVRALSLFVRNPQYNEAWTADNEDAYVHAVARERADEFAGDLPAGDTTAYGFEVHEVEVPAGAFTVDYDGDPQLRRVRNAIYSTSAWGGGGTPLWLQGDEYHGAFVLQFDEGFVFMNLGDCGIMYVFADTAFWQCH